MEVQPKESRLEEFIENPKKSMWKLSLPMMLGMSVQAIYMLVDTAFIGKWVGGTALAGLGYVFPYFFILMGITFGLGSGATTVIAQYIGSKDKQNADNAAEHTVLLGILIGVTIIIFGFLYGKRMIGMQGADEETVQVALDYFYIMTGGSIFMVLSVFFRSILSGEGDMMFPMKVLGVGTVLNIILDPIFIYYYQIAGAAMATVISQALVTVVFIYALFFKEHSYVTFKLKDFKYNFGIIKEIFRLGIPASLSMIIMSMGILLFNRILGSSDAVAAYQTAGRIEHLFFLPIISIATSLVTLVGMFYGAKRIDLVKLMVKYGLTRSVSISFSFSILFYFFSGSLMPLFTNSDEISRLAVLYFKIMAFAYPFITIGMTSTRIMQGLGYAYPMFILTLFRVVIIAASLAWYFVMVLGKPVHYAFVGTLISCILTSFVSITWLRSIIRKSFQPVLETG
ncbi:MAG: MATE family efflux transporter [Candidatus Marinimicrobia bacterium]|nr:MATE family efflux transporter [Candidatus Neomarinimicrobiota bacterium]